MDRRLANATTSAADFACSEDSIFIEKCQDTCRQVVPTPVPFDMVLGCVAPDLSATEAEQIGFSIAIFSGLMLSAAYQSCPFACIYRVEKHWDSEYWRGTKR